MTTSSRITSDQGVVIMQYLARALFAALAVIYFHHADSFFFALPKATPWLLFAAYVASGPSGNKDVMHANLVKNAFFCGCHGQRECAQA